MMAKKQRSAGLLGSASRTVDRLNPTMQAIESASHTQRATPMEAQPTKGQSVT